MRTAGRIILLRFLLGPVFGMASSVALAEPVVLRSSDPLMQWKSVVYPGGDKKAFTVGIGSGAFRHPTDPENSVYVISDRGPNIACDDAKKFMGKAAERICERIDNSRYFPTPDYTPSIYRLEIDRSDKTFRIKDVIGLKTADGVAVSGLLLDQENTDTGIDLDGKVLSYDPNGVDAEALVRLSDGSFWVVSEMGPSLLKVALDGRILRRLVPKGTEQDHKGAVTEIVASLPGILSRRKINRGFESLAVSPDERHLYFILQSPLAHPDKATYKKSRNVRLLKLELAGERVVGEFVYHLDEASAFGPDVKDQKDLRISEMMALGPDRFLVLERTNTRVRFHEISLKGATNILNSKWDDPDHRPSLEKMSLKALSDAGIVAVSKTETPVLDTKDVREAPDKIEGMALLGDGSLFLINDNDFGIGGDPTIGLIIKGPIKADKAVFKR